MQILGEPIFAKTPDGTLLSRVGTMFFKTPGLVTKRGVHAMQRAMWIDYLSDDSRILYGSDWPLVDMKDYIALMRRVVPERAHEGFFDGNARRVFGLPQR